MKMYKNMKDVERELKILNLERQIAWEEIKGLKDDYAEDLKPAHWIQTGLNFAGKYGVFMLLKKIIK
ncbi:hypothetical protein Q4566_09195 [Tamlana sp. 2_MG-2023]|uniref:hypothetical protein n=2 Tax=unclassified Tamlana TaxID=2614803 RepID=UPI0026E1B2A5|nr:hypothetical protein [Tamlana sp. 2_MG-2023]MDO6760370.1 hypothetical protein [Tamlana sp. 2_MG-2023]MDO6789932.1 hypothetical protein [Tamlana sp. 1_MG-2023]